MICYQCGCELTKENFCTNCGAETGLYKKICATSNLYYNWGLDKARVRDLSGAVESLKLSLKYNKRNTDARNLLGLVYHEMGETALAIREWVLSTNFYPKQDGKNLAEGYLAMFQEEGLLESAGKAVRKFNLALSYCYSDGYDLAMIQLKRVCSNYPRYVKAHQLLGLLYLREENWHQARRVLEKCLKIDNGSPLTQKLYQEALRMTEAEEHTAQQSRGHHSKESVRYMDDNETIISPMPPRGSFNLVNGLIYGAIGIALGVSFSLFLVMPARVASERASYEEQTREIAEQIDAKNASIADLERQIDALERDKTDLEDEIQAFSETGGGTDATGQLILAARAYIDNPENVRTVGEYLASADSLGDPGALGESYRQLYSALVAAVGPSLAEDAYNEGTRLYQASSYAEAIPYFEQAMKMDSSNPQTYLMLGNAYRRNNDTENAIRVYEQLIDRLPDSEEAFRAAESLGELQGV